jgi:hypothetical protein
MNIKNTKRSADTEPVGILRLGRFNSPKTIFNLFYLSNIHYSLPDIFAPANKPVILENNTPKTVAKSILSPVV